MNFMEFPFYKKKNTETIPDQFRIKVKIAKVQGKSKTLQSQYIRNRPKGPKIMNFMEFPIENSKNYIGKIQRRQKYLEKIDPQNITIWHSASIPGKFRIKVKIAKV